MSERYIPKYLLEDIEYYITIVPTVKKIQTNGNVASYLQDINGYVLNIEGLKTTMSSFDPYKLGSLKEIDIYVDPIQMWNDNKIFFLDENNEHLLIQDVNLSYYEEQSMNHERSDKLKMILDDDVELTKRFKEEQERLEMLRKKANLHTIFRDFVFNLLNEHPEIKKIKTSQDVCSKLDLFETRLNLNKSFDTFTISLKAGSFRGRIIPEYDKKIFDEKLIFYLDNEDKTDEILFLDENDNEIYKTNMSSI